MCQFSIAKKNMTLKFAWDSFLVISLCISGIQASVSLKCDENNWWEKCTISNVRADKENSTSLRFNNDIPYQNLQYIEFVDCTLYEVPKVFFTEMPYVVALSAPNCSIVNVRKLEFGSANKLLKLILSNNEIETINHMVFWGVSNLLELDLSSNRISSIRETAFYGLEKLVELNLANNRIAEVKSEFFRDLKSLKSISLEHNEIVSLDNNLFDNNILLETVQLFDNKIVNVGQAFSMRQHNLKYLYLHNNSIEDLNCTTIRADTINLNSNKLQNLKISADTLQLFANNNQISNITVEDPVKITHLSVSHNQITDISPIKKLSTLEYLNLSGNSIGRLSIDKFAALSRLIRLGLSYTNISNLEYGTFSHQPDLTELDISYNSLKRIDLNIFVSLTSLQNLGLDGNDLTEIAYEDIKRTLPNLESVSLSDNNWNCTYLTAMIKTMISKCVEIKIDPSKLVRNSTNQKGIACRDTKNEHLKHWQAPVLKFDATMGDGFNATAYTQEITKTIDKLIASMNSTDVESLKEQVTQHQGRLKYLEKKLTDQEMKLVKTQLQISTANSTHQTQNIHTLIDQLNNLTLQRQQLNNDVLSQKIYELNYNVDRNVKNLERLEAFVKAKDSSVDMERGFRDYQRSPNDVRQEQGSMVVINVVAILIAICIVFHYGSKVMVYYKSRQKRRMSVFSNRTSTVALEQSI